MQFFDKCIREFRLVLGLEIVHDQAVDHRREYYMVFWQSVIYIKNRWTMHVYLSVQEPLPEEGNYKEEYYAYHKHDYAV